MFFQSSFQLRNDKTTQMTNPFGKQNNDQVTIFCFPSRRFACNRARVVFNYIALKDSLVDAIRFR